VNFLLGRSVVNNSNISDIVSHTVFRRAIGLPVKLLLLVVVHASI